MCEAQINSSFLSKIQARRVGRVGRVGRVERFAVGHFVVGRFTVVVVIQLPRAAAAAVSQVA